MHGTVCAADLNGDGSQDIVSLDQINSGEVGYLSSLTWWKNTGTDDYTRFTITPAELPGISLMGAVDMDRDGDIDIVTGSESSDSISWWENNLPVWGN